MNDNSATEGFVTLDLSRDQLDIVTEAVRQFWERIEGQGVRPHGHTIPAKSEFCLCVEHLLKRLDAL